MYYLSGTAPQDGSSYPGMPFSVSDADPPVSDLDCASTLCFASFLLIE